MLTIPCLFLFLTLGGVSAAYKPSLRLPDPLTFINGTPITSTSQWPARRVELQSLLDTYIFGTKPDKKPEIIEWAKINETSFNGGVSAYFSFQLSTPSPSNSNVTITLELLCPDVILNGNCQQGSGYTLPIIMTQYNHREWGQRAVQRRMCSVRCPTS